MISRHPHKSTASEGFTVAEVLVAMAVAVVLGSIVFAVVAGTMQISASTETRAAMQARASEVLKDFTNTVDYTESVVTATRSVLVVETRDETLCHRHEYRFMEDLANPGKLSFTYTRTSVGVPIEADCTVVRSALDGGLGAFTFGYAVSDLSPDSGFSYYDLTGARAYRPGDSNFSTSTAVNPCFLGRVSMTLTRQAQTREGVVNIEDIATALLRGNIRAVGACH